MGAWSGPATAISLVLIAACTRSEPAPSNAPPAAPPPQGSSAPSPSVVGSTRFTHHPLSDFCRDRPCAYAAYKARIAKWTPCARGEAGTCGVIKWIHLQAIDGSETAYFDEKGQMIGAETSSDMSLGAVYGVNPLCNRQPTEHLCGLKPGERSQ